MKVNPGAMQRDALAQLEEDLRARDDEAAHGQAIAMAEQATMNARHVRLTIESVGLSGVKDALVLTGNQLRFLVSVSVDFDSQRSERTRVPSEGTKRLTTRKGHRRALLNQEVFSAPVGIDESLVVDIRPLAEDGGGGQHFAGRIRHVFVPSPDGGETTETIHGKFRPIPGQRYTNWTATIRVSVDEVITEVDRPDPGENIDHSTLAAQWEREVFGRPGSRETVDNVLARMDHRVDRISELTPPGDTVMASGADRAFLLAGRKKVGLRSVKNPAPMGSLGYCSDTFSVPEKSPDRYRDIVVPLTKIDQVDRNTVRLFHWETRSESWRLLETSAAHPDHDAVWGKTRLRGCFVAIGRPKHPAIRAAFGVAKALAPLIGNAGAAGLDHFNTSICHLILCTDWDWHAGIMEGAFGELDFALLDQDPKRAQAELVDIVMDWRRQSRRPNRPTAPGGEVNQLVPGVGPGDVCERCLDLPDLSGLPEIALLPVDPPWGPFEPPMVFDPPPPVFGIDPCERWENIGPVFPSCVVRDVAFDPDDSDIIYAATQRGGVWRTHNGGNNWAPQTDHLPNLRSYAVAVAGAKRSGATHRTVYAAMIENNLGVDFDLYASENGGRHWERRAPVPGAEGNITPLVLATGKTDANLLYLCTQDGLFKSVDAGRSWITKDVVVDGSLKRNAVSLFDGTVWQVKIDPSDDNTVWIAVRNRGIYVSRNGGDVWSLTTAGVPLLSGPGHMRLAIGQDGTRNGGNFVVASVGGTVAFTDDGGISWRVVPAAPNTETYGGWCSAVAVCPHDERIVILGTLKAQKTDDITASAPVWNDLPGYDSWAGADDRANWHADIQRISFDPNDSDTFLLATDGGVTRTNLAGTTIRRISDGMVVGQHFFMDVSQTGPFQAGASTYHTGIIKKRPTGRIWDMIGGNEGGIYRIDPRQSNIHFKSPWGGGLSRSTMNGDAGTWVKPTGFGFPGDDNPYVMCLEIAPDGPIRVWAGTFFDRLVVSTDNGATFRAVKDSAGMDLQLDGTGDSRHGVACIAFAPSNGRVVYIGTKTGRIWKTTTAGLSASSWSQLPTLPKPASSASPNPVVTIAVDPANSNRLYVGYNKLGEVNVFRSTNGGNSWEPATGALPSLELPRLPVVDLWFDPGNANRLFAALQYGIYTTHDASGDWWRDFSDGLPRAVRLAEMRVRKNSRTLYVATSGRGIWQRKL